MQFADAGDSARSQPLIRKVWTQRFRISERLYPANAASPTHTHRNHYIIITLDGHYMSTFGARTEEFKPWTVSFHRAGASHTSLYGDRGAKVLYVELPVEELRTFDQEPGCHMSTVSLQGGIVEWMARHLYNEFDHPDHLSHLVLDSFVLQLLAQVCRRSRERPESLPIWLGHANDLIRERFTEPLSLSKIAKAVNVHPVHMAREFRRHYLCTVGEQIRRLRIEYACDKLTTSSCNLADIALSAGFSDQSHFAVAFKKQIGTAPSRYRRRTQIEKNASAEC